MNNWFYIDLRSVKSSADSPAKEGYSLLRLMIGQLSLLNVHFDKERIGEAFFNLVTNAALIKNIAVTSESVRGKLVSFIT